MTVPSARSPLTAHMYHLDYPRSLGVYTTYEEVQAVVDALADAQFPVQHTMIVGTDLKLIERVTGRKTWGRVIGGGVISGLWMGLFIGVLFMLLGNSSPLTLVSTALMGAVFFGVWSGISHAMTGGKRDFTSMLATIPMQYELMVEHTHAAAARELLASQGAAPAPAPAPAPRHGGARGNYGTNSAQGASGRYGTNDPSGGNGGYGTNTPSGSHSGYGTSGESPLAGSADGYGSRSSSPGAAPAPQPENSPSRSSRPNFGLPADDPQAPRSEDENERPQDTSEQLRPADSQDSGDPGAPPTR